MALVRHPSVTAPTCRRPAAARTHHRPELPIARYLISRWECIPGYWYVENMGQRIENLRQQVGQQGQRIENMQQLIGQALQVQVFFVPLAVVTWSRLSSGSTVVISDVAF